MECGDLFFSEYIEGSSYSKAIEIYNGTGSSINLSVYTLELYSNGATSPSQTMTLSGSLAEGDVVVLAHSSADPVILAQSDIQNSSVINFNGDDALVLRSGGSIVDVIGQIGYDPGSQWGSGSISTQDNTIRRISTVGAGDTNGSDAFDPAIEWDGFAQNTFDGLGSHFTTGCGSGDVAPIVTSTTPANSANNIPVSSNISVNFSENVTVVGDWYYISCTSSGNHSATASGGPQNFTLNPVADFTNSETCTVTVYASQVTDQDVPLDPMASDHIWSFTTSSGSGITHIYTIQGTTDVSPLVGNTVTTSGIVVGDFQDAEELSGFFLQDASGDGDTATSDGMFIYVPEANTTWYGSDVQTGQEVSVTGRVNEYNTFTEIDFVTDITISDPTPSPLAATPVTLPETTDGDLERYEGMLITFSSSLTVAQNYFLGQYGQMTLSGSGRLYQPTNQFAPGSTAATALADSNARSWLFLDDGSDSENPTTAPYLGSPPPSVIRAGDTISGLTGVLDYGQINRSYDRDYRLHPTISPSFTEANTRTIAPSSVGGSVTVSSFNVLNYFVTLDGSGSICGPTGGQECRGADSSSEFTRQRDKIIAAICAINADVFGLMELENTNPSNDPNTGDAYNNYVLLDLVNGLNDAGSDCPDKTYTFVDSTATGTDAIQVGIIYKSSTMSPVSGLIVLDDPGFLDPNNLGSSKNRPAQALAFEDSSGERFSVVVNHLKSKGSSCGAGDDDLTTGQGNCNLTRTLAAAYQRDWIAEDPTGSGDVDYLVLGDLNAYAQEDPIMAFGNNGFLNLIDTFVGANAYSYIFDGQSGYLDHAIAHSSFPAQLAGMTVWQINADEPSVIDYDEFWNPPNYYSDTPYRASDHDPVVIGLDLQPEITGTINGIAEGVTHNFPNGICGSITFTTIGTVDHVEITYRQSHPSVNSNGLPRGYEIRAFDSGSNEVTTGFVANMMMCYADIELHLAGIADEDTLHAYRYAGSEIWEENSVLDSTNNTVTAENVTALGHWGLGNSTEQPTALSVQNIREQSNPVYWVPGLLLIAAFSGIGLWVFSRYQKEKQSTKISD